MSHTPTLWDAPAHSHADGDLTEKQAPLGLNLTKLRTDVLREIVHAGEVGRTAVEVEAALGLKRPTGSSRVSELRNYEYIEASNIRRLTPSRRSAIVWIATDAGREALAAFSTSAVSAPVPTGADPVLAGAEVGGAESPLTAESDEQRCKRCLKAPHNESEPRCDNTEARQNNG